MTDSKGARMKRRKARLFAENPNCCFCGEPMVMEEQTPHQTPNPYQVVLFHTVGKLGKEGIPSTVLCCFKCAGIENDKKQKAVGIEELRARAGSTRCPYCGHVKSGAAGSPPVERPNLEEDLPPNPDLAYELQEKKPEVSQ